MSLRRFLEIVGIAVGWFVAAIFFYLAMAWMVRSDGP